MKLNSSAGYYNEILQSYIDVVHNKTKQDEVKALKQLLNTQITSIKKNMDEFVKTNRKQYVKDAIELYVTDMAETIHKLNNTKYSEMRVDYSPVTKEYTLIQKSFTDQILYYMITTRLSTMRLERRIFPTKIKSQMLNQH